MPISPIAFQPGTPTVQQIVNALTQAIDEGLLAPGSKLPSVREMTLVLGVSKFTLIEALDRLRGQARITSSQGLGYFVAPAPISATAEPVDEKATERHGHNRSAPQRRR